MTNYDVFKPYWLKSLEERATPEFLAGWIARLARCDPEYCPAREVCPDKLCTHEECRELVLAWLNKEVSGEPDADSEDTGEVFEA